jgi:hypothetical protein
MASLPLATALWSSRSDGLAGVLRVMVLKLPLPYVPMTLQTLVVLLIGTAYGWRLGVATGQARDRESLAGWRPAVPCGIRNQECTRRGADTGDPARR